MGNKIWELYINIDILIGHDSCFRPIWDNTFFQTL